METIDKQFSNTDLIVTTQAKNFLQFASKWANFLSIMGFISLGLMVLAGFAVIVFGSAFGGIAGGMQMGMLGFIYLLMALLYFFPTYYLYVFASKMKKALNNNTQDEFDLGLENLKSFFKFIGIFTIIMISFYLVLFLFGFLFASAVRM